MVGFSQSLRKWLRFLLFQHKLSISLMALHLAGGMKEQDLAEIKLHGVSTSGLKNIIQFIYTSQLSLNLSTLQDTLEAASFLQVLPVLNFCNQLLSSEVLWLLQRTF